jgi:hypothetical protein
LPLLEDERKSCASWYIFSGNRLRTGERQVATAPASLVGKSLQWTGVHHSETGDFGDLSTHTVTYETADTCYVTANGQLVGEATYTYRRIDEQVGVVIYHPKLWQGRDDVVLYAIFDFSEMTDRAVVTSGGVPFAVANGRLTEVATPPKP